MYFSFGIFLVSRLSKVILQWEMIGKGKSCRENEREWYDCELVGPTVYNFQSHPDWWHIIPFWVFPMNFSFVYYYLSQFISFCLNSICYIGLVGKVVYSR